MLHGLMTDCMVYTEYIHKYIFVFRCLIELYGLKFGREFSLADWQF